MANAVKTIDLQVKTPRSLTSQAFESLRADIISCRLAPMEKLRVHALSERYGIGATAIREALSRLVSDGLVEATDQKGFRVCGVSRSELLDLTNTRIEIESLALTKSIANGDIEWEAEAISACHRLSRHSGPGPGATDEDKETWSKLHHQFHYALLAKCSSPWLLNICELLHQQSERYRHLAEFATKPSMRDTTKEHNELLQAILDRDALLACELLRKHFSRTTEILLEAYQTADNSLVA
ncbi:MAG: FCD domain-containing protein [Rhodocyclaceae bacterium]|nr:MAG: FCD domain-containing protein [Rhodocyclaceae bacterium]